MKRLVLLIFFCSLLAACSSSRWVVTDQFALDENADPVVLDQREVLLVEKEPTVSDPVISFAAYSITEEEYPLRVKVERSVQQYRPRWGFLALGVAGALFAVTAANSDVILPSLSTSQQLSLNLTAGVLAALSFVNMQPSGDPIFTGETELMRRSGIEVLKDSVRAIPREGAVLDELLVTYRDEELFRQGDLEFAQSSLDINLASFSSALSGIVDRDSEILLKLTYKGTSHEHKVQIDSFMAPFFSITEPIALIHSTPQAAGANVITEVGSGSFLEITDDLNEDWFRVNYQNADAYVQKNAGEKVWRAASDSGPALIFEFAEVPFGEIDVENLVPVLKERNDRDRALILTNGSSNSLGFRQYLDRDHQLFTHYMRTAFQMRAGQITTISEAGGGELNTLQGAPGPMNGEGSLYVYVSGFATVESDNDGNGERILLVFEDESGDQVKTPLNELFSGIAELNPGALYIFVDLDYDTWEGSNGRGRNGNGVLLQQAADAVLSQIPNSAIIFSNRPGQRSRLYTGVIDGNRRHHIFNYYWAEAIKQRNTRISDLLQHLRSNVDYTSRRLHDRPQEIQAFGNFTLNMAQ
jgi:hypothetical protein